MTRRGFSYVEMLVAIVLLVFLMTLSARFLIVSFRLSTEGSLEASMQSQAVVAAHRMLVDLQTGPAAMMRQNSYGFATIGMDTLTSLRTVVWEKKFKVYYHDPKGRKIWSKEYPPAPPNLGLVFDPSQPPYVSPEDLQKIFDTPNRTERLLCTDVDEFSLKHNGACYDLRIVLMARVRDYRARFELNKTLNFRNHL